MKPAVLTPQRRVALELLAEYRYLTTSDFYGLLEGGAPESTRARAVRRMLMLLHQAKLVYRANHVISRKGDPFLRYEHCYHLSRRGIAAISAGDSTPEKSPLSLDHELGITRFHLALAGAIRPTSYQLRWWQSELKRTVNPDALFALTDTTKPREVSTHYYFLEIEKSRQSHYRNGDSGLMAKLKRYSEYRRTERCRSEWRYFADFRVVVVLKDRKRQANLLRALCERLPHRFIWTTSEEEFNAGIIGAVFRAPPDHERTAHSLLE